ncbi:ABC transporter permease [Spelaeicoccus albus]|uniref:Transport permease protein n=1 Tax=Spelaeicoccus albus TaxID=1280376 RepID=A0A7Z0CZ27_9MICO|nr:ABC transporter permease [Spelaeicoccus albus]NYI65844.1 lipooligosaccharide transport system permease protein [Spelaeicoccus albus]
MSLASKDAAQHAHSPAVSAAKARRFGAWYVAEHKIRTMRGYKWTIAVDGVGSPIVYLFALGVGLATLVDKGMHGTADGVGYLPFVAPALLATAAMMTATEEFTYPVMDGFKWRRVYYGFNASPLSTGQLVDGIILGTAARLAATSIVYYIIMLIFGAVPNGGLGALTVPIALLCGLAVGTPLMSYSASITEDRGQFAMMMRFVITPLFLFSGTFFPLDRLPVYLQWIGWLSPLWHGSELGRVVSYGLAEPPWLTAAHIVYPLALAVAGWAVCRRLFARRLGK